MIRFHGKSSNELVAGLLIYEIMAVKVATVRIIAITNGYHLGYQNQCWNCLRHGRREDGTAKISRKR
jgi:hypothetical protein